MAAAIEILAVLQRRVMPEDDEARFTVGRLAALPGSINVIASEVTFSIDLRHPSAERLDLLETRLREVVAAVAGQAGVDARIERLLDMAPCTFDPALLSALEAAAGRLGHRTQRLRSGAFHDALFIASVAPSAMLFVPSRDGLSHNPAEFTASEDVVAGASTLLGTMTEVAGCPRDG